MHLFAWHTMILLMHFRIFYNKRLFDILHFYLYKTICHGGKNWMFRFHSLCNISPNNGLFIRTTFKVHVQDSSSMSWGPSLWIFIVMAWRAFLIAAAYSTSSESSSERKRIHGPFPIRIAQMTVWKIGQLKWWFYLDNIYFTV